MRKLYENFHFQKIILSFGRFYLPSTQSNDMTSKKIREFMSYCVMPWLWLALSTNASYSAASSAGQKFIEFLGSFYFLSYYLIINWLGRHVSFASISITAWWATNNYDKKSINKPSKPTKTLSIQCVSAKIRFFQLFLHVSKSQYFFPIWILIVLGNLDDKRNLQEQVKKNFVAKHCFDLSLPIWVELGKIAYAI